MTGNICGVLEGKGASNGVTSPGPQIHPHAALSWPDSEKKNSHLLSTYYVLGAALTVFTPYFIWFKQYQQDVNVILIPDSQMKIPQLRDF